MIEYMRSVARNHWPEGMYKELEDRAGSQCAGLTEIILNGKLGNGRKYYCRVLGFFGPRISDFTMLYPFDKGIDAQYEIPCRLDQNRKADVQQNWNRASECALFEA
jgi:hypothetical protein